MPIPFSSGKRRIRNSLALLSLAIPIALTLPPPGLTHAEGQLQPTTGSGQPAHENAPSPPSTQKQALPLVQPRMELWPDQIEANGNIMPWQESRIGTEVGGLRLVSVLVTVGDNVKKGQVLARLDPVTVETDLDTANAQLAETAAALAQAAATLERANRLVASGGVSQQELTLYQTQKHTAEARLSAARAQVKRQQLRLDFTTIVAPDDGLISASSAAEGAIVPAGSELFRLIRQGRLEWRAEVKGELLLRLSAGQEVTVKTPLGPEVKGHVRRLSPTIDIASGNGLAYVDLPPGSNLKAGLNVSGTISMGKRKALVLPVAAVQYRNGTTHVQRIDPDGKIETLEVRTGRTRDDQVEITAGLDEHAQVVFKDGDRVKDGSASPGPSP